MIERISAEEAHRRVEEEGWIYVDVRTVPEFEAGHPTGAYNVPWLRQTPDGRVPNPDFLAVMRRHFAPETKIVLGCRSGNRSLQAANAMAAEGWTALVDQRAGWIGHRDAFGAELEKGWPAAGLPVSTEASPGRSYAALVEQEDPT